MMAEKDIMPEGWETDVILQRSVGGTVGTVEVPDDVEVDADGNT